MSSHALIVAVTVRLMRCLNSCDLEHWTELPISGEAICPLELRNCEGGRTVIDSTDFQRHRGELSPG